MTEGCLSSIEEYNCFAEAAPVNAVSRGLTVGDVVLVVTESWEIVTSVFCANRLDKVDKMAVCGRVTTLYNENRVDKRDTGKMNL